MFYFLICRGPSESTYISKYCKNEKRNEFDHHLSSFKKNIPVVY